MAIRKPRSSKRTTAAARRAPAKKAGRKAAGGGKPERRRGSPETLRLRSFEPTFTVNDIERSLRFYTDVLGFIVIEEMTDGAALQGALLQAGTCTLGLSQDDWAKGRDRKKGEGMRIWCKTGQDINALAKRITAAGGQLSDEPKNQPQAARTLSIKDPDGFVLSIYREQ